MKRPPSPDNAWWLRWTRTVLAATALALPLIFDVRSIDSFARAKLAVLHLAVPLAIVGPLVGLLAGEVRGRVRLGWADAAVLAFAGLALVATAAAPDPSHAIEGEPLQFQGLVSLLMYVAAYFVARVVFAGTRGLRGFFVAVTIALAIVAGYGILQQLGLDPIWHGLDKGRIFSSLGQANNLAAFLVMAVPCAMALAASGRLAYRVAAGITVVLSLAALALTLSRGGYLALFAAVVVMGAAVVMRAAMLPRLRLDRRILAGGLLAVAAGTAIVLAVPSTRGQIDRVTGRLASTLEFGQSSIASHLDLWTVGFWMTVDHPIVGTGPDSYVLEFPSYRDRVLAPARAAVLARFRPESPHNQFLAISSGMGVPALAAYLALIGLALLRLVRSLRLPQAAGFARLAAIGLLGAIVAHVVSDAFMTAELTGSWLFWTFLGAAVSLPVDPSGHTAQEGGRRSDAGRDREGPGRPRTPRSH